MLKYIDKWVMRQTFGNGIILSVYPHTADNVTGLNRCICAKNRETHNSDPNRWK